MLSNVSIAKYVASGDIIIDPWDDSMMGAARVGLRLSERILIPKPGTIVDPKNNISPTHDEIVITDTTPFHLEPGMFILGETFEKIGLSEKIGSIIDGKSTFARLGVSIVQSAIIIDTGQAPKRMTLEIYNAGPNTVLLYPRLKFAKMCFFLLDVAASKRYDTEGKYVAGDANKPIFRNEIL